MARPVCLVVEDDALLRFRLIEFVEEIGYEALEARGADEAIVLLETRNDIRVLFTDIDMPGSMNGLKLAVATRDRWPPIEIIVTSGKQVLEDAELPQRGIFLPKPYTFEDTEAALKRLIQN